MMSEAAAGKPLMSIFSCADRREEPSQPPRLKREAEGERGIKFLDSQIQEFGRSRVQSNGMKAALSSVAAKSGVVALDVGLYLRDSAHPFFAEISRDEF